MGRMVERFLFFPPAFGAKGRTFAKCIFSNASSIFDHFGILDHLGPFQTMSDHFRPSWTILDHLGPNWTILDHLGQYWTVAQFQTISDQFWPFQAIPWPFPGNFRPFLEHLRSYSNWCPHFPDTFIVNSYHILTISDHFLTISWSSWNIFWPCPDSFWPFPERCPALVDHFLTILINFLTFSEISWSY